MNGASYNVDGGQDPTFSLMTKPQGKGPAAEASGAGENEEAKGSNADLKKSTITDYLPSIFGGKRAEQPAAAEGAAGSSKLEESKSLKDSVA